MWVCPPETSKGPVRENAVRAQAGDYTVTVNDNNYGCTVIKSYKILSPSLALNINSVTTTDVLCNPSAAGPITITHNETGVSDGLQKHTSICCY